MALQDSYNFLNSYLSKITGKSETPDDRPLQDENDFYDVPEQDDQDTDDAGYGIDQEDTDTGYNQDDDYQSGPSPDNGNEDAPLSDDDTTMGYSGDVPGGAPNTESPGSLGNSISQQESQGKYTATNKHSSATGKYQFLWSAWGDSIKKITGVKSKEDFLHSPKAQEQYYGWYEKNYLMPQVEKLRPFNKAGLSDQQLAKLVHFRGAGGAKKYLKGQLPDQPEKFNTPISKYIASHQAGGHGVAMSTGAQHIGLNNGSFSSMSFPMHGENEFRGLDDGTPVELTDEYGKKKVLKGKKHKTIMRGKVFEKRI